GAVVRARRAAAGFAGQPIRPTAPERVNDRAFGHAVQRLDGRLGDDAKDAGRHRLDPHVERRAVHAYARGAFAARLQVDVESRAPRRHDHAPILQEPRVVQGSYVRALSPAAGVIGAATAASATTSGGGADALRRSPSWRARNPVSYVPERNA